MVVEVVYVGYWLLWSGVLDGFVYVCCGVFWSGGVEMYGEFGYIVVEGNCFDWYVECLVVFLIEVEVVVVVDDGLYD